jgi:hypothetical protein
VSKRRPSQRDRVEREYLELAEEFAGVKRDYETRLAGYQRELARLEGDRGADEPGLVEVGPRRDALDAVPALSVAAAPSELAEDEALSGGELAGEDSGADRMRLELLKLSRLLIGTCQRAIQSDQPKLVLYATMLAADLPGAMSGRWVADKFGLSAERVSQLFNEIQVRHQLPANRHNKSAAAVNAYRENAGLINQPKIA